MRLIRMCRPPAWSIATIVVAFALLSFSGSAKAATPSLKLLAVTGPSNLPPRQSEVQRLTIEAEGGAFELGRREKITTPEIVGAPEVDEARLNFVAGSSVATIESVAGEGRVEPGDRIARSEEREGTTIVSCSTDCESLGSALVLSEPATTTESGAVRQIYTRQVKRTQTFDPNPLQVGDEIVKVTKGGEESCCGSYFPPGTKVTAASPTNFELSNPPTEAYIASESFLKFLAERVVSPELTAPIPYGAPPAKVQQELEKLPAFGPGSVSVESSEVSGSSYVVEFGGAEDHGPLALRDVPQLEVETSGLIGQPSNVSTNVFTTVPGGPGTGEVVIFPANAGAAASEGSVTLQIGPLPAGIHATGEAAGPGWTCEEDAGLSTIVCTSAEPVPAFFPMETVRFPVEVEPAVATSSTLPIRISSGGSEPDIFQLPVEISATPAPFATRAFWSVPYDADGRPVDQAGAHPESIGTYFLLNTVRSGAGQVVPAGVLKDAVADLPPGFIGNPMVTPRCPQAKLAEPGGENNDACNPAMAVGRFGVVIARITNGPGQFGFSQIFNDVPAQGYAAEFTTKIIYLFQSLLGSIRSDEDFGVRVTAPNIGNTEKIYGSYVVLEGKPAAAQGKAFLTNPTDCALEAQDPPTTGLKLEAYELPGVPSTTPIPFPATTGCDRLHFAPRLALAPSTAQGSSPAGAAVDLHLPQEGLTDSDQLAEPDLRKATVVLPEGLALNPSAADGLASCTEAQVGYVGPGPAPNRTRFDEDPVTCPDASKLGTVKVRTPLLESELEGTIYLAAQEENPFDSLLAVYLVVESGRFGVTLKLPGKVEADPRTGRLTATFDDNPQVPFEDLVLSFRGGGPRSIFATPEVCGHYATTGSLEPWSAPESGPAAQISEGGFDVTGGCSGSAGARPFGPSLDAGTTSTAAGAYSPLVVKVARRDGEQELRSLDFSLPKGLLGRVAGIPYCPDASIRAAEGRSAVAEQASPSCPAASRIGSVDTAAGVGPEPLHVGGSVYLAGPYEGAPLSAVVVVPALAGPFDLGVVVIRAALHVDPESAEITAESDPIPTILRGIPLKLRSVAIDLDRPGFTLNPTSCEPMLVTAQILGSGGQLARPQDRFQVGGCNRLGFGPRLKIGLRGSTTRTGHPGLRAVLAYPKKGAHANIRRAQVNLPRSVILDQGNLDKTCTRPVLLEGRCPKSTIYGRARAWTPLLAGPLEGPVYLVGGYGFKLPALVAELDGQIRVVLKGKVDTGPNKGIRNTFEAVPDAPVSRFVLDLKGGRRYGLLQNSQDLCARRQRAIVRFTGQNGKVAVMRPSISSRCGRKR